MKIRISTDLLTGLFFLALGGFAIAYGSRYPVGTAARMGPGYFPLLASSGLVLLGLVLVARAVIGASEQVGAVNPRSLLFVLAGTLAFGLLIERGGLLLSGVLLVFAARFAERDVRPVETGILAACLLAFTVAVFWYGLGLPLRLLPFR